MLNAKKGLSALQVSRDLQVNKNTAWRIAMQIRKAMNQVDQQRMLSGIVEMEETYVGGKPRKGKKYDNPEDKPKPDRSTKKAPVIGALERMGNVTAKAVPKSKMKGRNLRAFHDPARGYQKDAPDYRPNRYPLLRIAGFCHAPL